MDRAGDPMPGNDGEQIRTEVVFETITQPLLVLDGDLRVETANPAFLRQFEVAERETSGSLVYELGDGQWNIPGLRRLLEEVLVENGRVEGYRVEHEFEQIGKRIMLLNGNRLRREGAPDRILLAFTDITEAERLRFELEDRIEFADKLIDSMREALLILHWDLRVHSANEAFYERFEIRPEETEGRMVYDLGNGQWDIPGLRDLLERILPEEWTFDDYEVEHEFESIGRRTMVLNARRLDHLDLILLAIRDVTEEREHQRRQKTFLSELQHRMKNILNNVRALAHHTRRGSRNLDEFFDSFETRLAALGRAQDLLMQSPSEALALPDIVRIELEAVGAEENRNFTTSGPTIRLPPRDAQSMSMVVHELATNAGKYGALTTGEGRIEVTWRVENRDDERHLCFNWRERGAEIADTNPSKGFGSDVIEKSLPHMLGGSAALTFHPDGAECVLEFPLPN